MTFRISASSKPPRRFMRLFLPHWPTDRLKRRNAALRAGMGPLVLYEKAASALRIHALDEAGAGLGLYEGQPLAEARAIEPSLIAAPADADGDARDFCALAEGLTRYAPFVGIGAVGDAVLDISGCAHLFGGEEALIGDALARLSRAGFSARAAIADSPGAAYAAAHYGGMRIIPPGGAGPALAELPVAALRISPDIAATLSRLGLKRIGQLYAMPRAPLTARMGAEVLKRLAEALGTEDEPINPLFPAPEYEASAPLLEPIVSAEAILVCLEKMARELEALLARDGKGGRRFDLIFYRVDNRLTKVAVGASRPTRKPAVLLRLFKDRLADCHDPRDAGFGYDLLKLKAFDCAPYEAGAPARFDAPESEGDIAALADRLANRMGGARVCLIRLLNAHMPERSAEFAPFAGAGRLLASKGSFFLPPLGEGEKKEEEPARPLTLLARPEAIAAIAGVPDGPPMRFIWRRVSYPVRRASGPERLAGDWRREEEERARDYYRVEDASGRRFWIYREGLFGECAAPKWFLHGFFG